MTIKNKPLFIIVFVLALIVCFVLGTKVGKLLLSSKISEYEKMLDYYAPIPTELYSISGKILSIQDKIITLEATSPTERKIPGKEATMVDYKVSVTDNTRINKTVVNINPEKTKITNLKLSDLKVGDKVAVRTIENIVSTTNLTGDLINLIIFPKI